MTSIKSLIVNDPDLAKCKRLSTDNMDVYVDKSCIDDFEMDRTDEDYYDTYYYFTISGNVCKFVEDYYEEYIDGVYGRTKSETVVDTVEKFNKFKEDVIW